MSAPTTFMPAVARNKALAPSQVETRSVDFVPHAERFGKSRDLGNVWFVGNVNLTAMATGVVALSLGGNLIWTVIAVVLGSLFGTFFMAFHSAQGPQLGLPQLVQSRAQFGYIGAATGASSSFGPDASAPSPNTQTPESALAI